MRAARPPAARRDPPRHLHCSRLVLRGRFDREAAPAEDVPQWVARSARRVPLLGLAVALGGAGIPLVLVFDGGVALAIGIIALLAFVALASLAIVSVLSSPVPSRSTPTSVRPPTA